MPACASWRDVPGNQNWVAPNTPSWSMRHDDGACFTEKPQVSSDCQNVSVCQIYPQNKLGTRTYPMTFFPRPQTQLAKLGHLPQAPLSQLWGQKFVDWRIFAPVPSCIVKISMTSNPAHRSQRKWASEHWLLLHGTTSRRWKVDTEFLRLMR